jgi:hypothetical protein
LATVAKGNNDAMAVGRYQNLDLAGRDRAWDSDAAESRVRKWAGAEEGPDKKYRSAFLWYDKDAPDRFGSYKFPIADVVGGKLKAVPRAIISAAGVVDGARGGAHIPTADIPALKRHIARYYKKMGDEPPWGKKAAKSSAKSSAKASPKSSAKSSDKSPAKK